MKILISGASGLVGSALVRSLQRNGHDIQRLIRAGRQGVKWDPETYEIEEPRRLAERDAVVHLAGEPIVGRWSDEKKRRIRDSRVNSTRALSDTLAGLQNRPSVLIVASAVGYYGNRGDETLTEDSAPGDGFLADVCKEWEAAAAPARDAGIRVVHVRFGMLLSPDGGALKAMLTPFKLGLGGRVGSGSQFVSWASVADAVGVIQHAIETDSLQGAVNVVSPTPATNMQLTKALGAALSRPTGIPVPAFAARTLFGEMADALLLASQRVLPGKLTANGYTFRHTDLEQTLRELL